ncbi:TPA: hypothetical protein NGR75_004240 [Vibrio parahaemolyticus]|nr:hypothetical protein [Vibrio parahaemolyticus]EJG1289551.1 hypothetical protein [Vibrio parahaemolyticus]EJG1299350.1 hypothetical protein [Vibrio parahaemolyticus]EJG1332053.1 hypothetical protein [Vibrio parahaemolyticus]MCF9344560.1 hypothetical protein [Vibrio parahaemolyticus]
MAISFKGCKFNNVGTVVKAPETVDVDFENSDVGRVRKVVDLYPTSRLRDAGLPEDISQEQLKDLLDKLKANQNEKDIIATISSHPLAKTLGLAADTLTITSPIVAALLALMG